MILALSIPLLAVAEPSGRGADFGEVSSLATDVNMLILGAICLVVCTIFYFFKDRHKALETIFYIFLIIEELVHLQEDGHYWQNLLYFQ